MYNSLHIIVPLDSDAVQKIEWNSATEELHTTYSGGEKSYASGRVTYGEFEALRQEARNRGSWGSALYHWKENRVSNFEDEDRQAFDVLTATLHPETVKRFAEWMQEVADQQTVSARVDAL